MLWKPEDSLSDPNCCISEEVRFSLRQSSVQQLKIKRRKLETYLVALHKFSVVTCYASKKWFQCKMTLAFQSLMAQSTKIHNLLQ